jgi:YD repeat-containing protein
MPDGSERAFEPDSRSPAYFSQPGDTGTLTVLAGGAFTLRERRGFAYYFRSDGSLDHVEDTNGNQVKCDYAGGQLTALTHSSGRALQLSYNSVGRLQRLTDLFGRVVTYTYDSANEHLTSVQDYDGKVTAYTYSSGQGPPVSTLSRKSPIPVAPSFLWSTIRRAA